jgi:cell division protein FtsQ
MRNAIETRPEFMVNLMAIDGATDAVAQDIRTILPLDFPTSSFDLDLPAMRDVVAQLAPIKDVAIRTEDALVLLDVTGVEIAEELVRSSRPHLPLVAGMGADDAVPEALALYRAAGPLSPRLRGLVRMGERRWDVILDRDQRIMLPAEDPVPALERVIALSEAQDVLARDVALIDMRLAARPTLKMNPDALTQWWRITQPLRAEQTDD